MRYRSIALILLAGALPASASVSGTYSVPYIRVAVRPSVTPLSSTAFPEVQSPGDYPLRHPFKTFVDLNRNGEDVFRKNGALPYVALGVVALATDRQTEKWFKVAAPGEPTPKFARTFNNFGDGKIILPAMGILYLLGRSNERDTARLWGVAVLNATVFTQSLKMLTGKERPNQSPDAIRYHGPSTRFDSWPSGHMTAATASAVVLGHQYPKAKLGFYALAACVGIARIEGGNHWPSDVYWGAGVGYYGARQVLVNKVDVLNWRF